MLDSNFKFQMKNSKLNSKFNGRREAEKLAHLLESASLTKSIWIKIIKKYAWISFLHFPIHKGCIKNYENRCSFRFPEDWSCVNLPGMAGELAR